MARSQGPRPSLAGFVSPLRPLLRAVPPRRSLPVTLLSCVPWRIRIRPTLLLGAPLPGSPAVTLTRVEPVLCCTAAPCVEPVPAPGLSLASALGASCPFLASCAFPPSVPCLAPLLAASCANGVRGVRCAIWPLQVCVVTCGGFLLLTTLGLSPHQCLNPCQVGTCTYQS